MSPSHITGLIKEVNCQNSIQKNIFIEYSIDHKYLLVTQLKILKFIRNSKHKLS